MTNAEKIRQMTDEEIVNLFQGKIHACCRYNETTCFDRPSCKECWEEWLQEEANDE